MPLLSTAQIQGPEYEPLNPNEEAEFSSWTEKQAPQPSASPALTPRIFWALCLVTVLSIVNSALYPRTVSTSAQRYAPADIPFIGSSPGLDAARAKAAQTPYIFAEPVRLVRVSAHAETAVFEDSRLVSVTAHESTIMEFYVPPGNSSKCAMAFIRPPLAVTHELTGDLRAVQVWEIPSSAQAGTVGAVSFTKDTEHMVTTLDLTKQTAMMSSKEFECGAEERRIFEFRCAKERCAIKYNASLNTKIGFQLKRKA